jgi:hypothetical protein
MKKSVCRYDYGGISVNSEMSMVYLWESVAEVLQYKVIKGESSRNETTRKMEGLSTYVENNK